jgi:hypothetical protein
MVFYHTADNAMVDLFADFIERDDSLGAAIREIERERGSLNRHYILLLQSSGYGKTRKCLELLKSRKGLYLLCDDVRGGFRHCSLFDNLPSPMTKELTAKLLENLMKFIDEAISPAELFRKQFSVHDGKYLSDFYPGAVAEPATTQSLVAADTQRKNQKIGDLSKLSSSSSSSPSSPTSSYSCSTHSVAFAPFDANATMGIIVFDEAHNLGQTMIALLKVALDQFNLIGIFLSTCGQLHEVLPRKMSNRDVSRRAVDPVYKLFTTDIYSERILFLGRPLWFQWWNTKCMRNDLSLIMYAADRLIGYVTEWEGNINSTISLFMCRFGGLSPSNYTSGSKFVAENLATYQSIGVKQVGDVRELTCVVGYLSEPVLAIASAYCTRENEKKPRYCEEC